MKIKYQINEKEKIEIEVDEKFASAYLEIETESRREEERQKWHNRKNLTQLNAMEESSGPIADPKSNFVESYIEKENVESAMQILTAEQREVIQLFYFQGYKKSEIAEIKGISNAAVGQQINRALKQMKNYFEKN